MFYIILRCFGKTGCYPTSVGEVKSRGTSAEALSSESVIKDWNHWVVLHGKEKEAVEDV